MKNKDKALLAGGILGGAALGANAGKILKGVAFGILAIVFAFVVLWHSANGVEDTSNNVADMELQALDDLDTNRVHIKGYGEVSSADELAISVLIDCDIELFLEESEDCEFSSEELLYFSVEKQRYEVIRDVQKEEGSNTETVSYSQEWVTHEESEEWAELEIDGIEINMDKARTIFEEDSETIENALIEDLDPIQTYDQAPEEDAPAFGTTRALVRTIPNDGREILVVGEIRDDKINSGDPFIVTDKSDSELVSQLGTEESTKRFGLAFLGFALLTFGFTSMLSPVLVFTDWIPLLGKAARGVATLVSAILAAIITVFTLFILNYWWVILLVMVLGVGGFMYWARMRDVSIRNTPEGNLR